MSGTKKLGELLKDAGLIDDFQLHSALSHQRNWGGKLGAILVELGFLREEDVAKAIAQKLKIPYAQLFEQPIPDDVVQSLKADVAKKYRVIPVKKEKHAIVVAMADPLDITIIDDLRFITGLNIKPALAFESEITDALKKYYDHEEIVHQSRPFRSELARIGKSDVGTRQQDIVVSKEGSEDQRPVPTESPEPAEQFRLSDDGRRLEALIALLLEKGIFTRKEFETALLDKKNT